MFIFVFSYIVSPIVLEVRYLYGMRLFDLLKEMDESPEIVNEWKVINIGRNEKGFYTISKYSSGGDSLSMFHLELAVLYADDYLDPQAHFSGDVKYFGDDIKQAGMDHSYEFVGYASNTPTQNYITDIKFKVVNGVVDFDNPHVSHM